MASGYSFVDVVNYQRERDQPKALADAARFLPDYQFRAAQSAAIPRDKNGYTNGGGYQSFFTLGVSTFGNGDELA